MAMATWNNNYLSARKKATPSNLAALELPTARFSATWRVIRRPVPFEVVALALAGPLFEAKSAFILAAMMDSDSANVKVRWLRDRS